VISCGANVPFADKEIFWANHGRCRPQSKLDPDFISNWYGACICLLHGKKVQMTDEAIFHDTSEIKKAILKAYALNNSKLILALPLLKSL
jgi:hypothetical protein